MASSKDQNCAERSSASENGTQFGDVAELTYEQARDQLIGVVQRLESGQAPLEETMALWERGEALAEHCSSWLDKAEKRIEDRLGSTVR
ncbi:exodeoxyribonuclease VII small subunit [Dermatophilus congolensis]|uniref:exodeoxyribonuclease VII small subunit n=1 Tax=Dermatophilus congolensis TaxID=1863 RepID=UPI001AAF8604|nr:exodeoxyribonuclease VII small subunit [Dermatophilus congolensis]MBO3129729.1 exodeoxyribonuclease VII small subunit [Dermatophilus congolensis]MBO3131641.1 exodeoxyribonuclease VII small subunit [Dermatophilus congolensis]MBO3134203.1 exodeoxyribonuclease VII small subunit [Dermatophilus congolensis]MBO3136436.1 exodeoxyribonuclease VII small subunit [Dermatophilus congolensis]MBO3138685.1 exodeoxyribonuclease VII small subunit [Dermatophilus congolensis]